MRLDSSGTDIRGQPHTARGQAVHHLVDTPGYEMKAGVKVESALLLWSDRLGLIGKADIVEFHPDGTVFPVEFKHGPKRQKIYDDIQLAAQAMYLEDILGHAVPDGAIYHASSHRRREVAIATPLREKVIETAAGGVIQWAGMITPNIVMIC